MEPSTVTQHASPARTWEVTCPYEGCEETVTSPAGVVQCPECENSYVVERCDECDGHAFVRVEPTQWDPRPEVDCAECLGIGALVAEDEEQDYAGVCGRMHRLLVVRVLDALSRGDLIVAEHGQRLVDLWAGRLTRALEASVLPASSLPAARDGDVPDGPDGSLPQSTHPSSGLRGLPSAPALRSGVS